MWSIVRALAAVVVGYGLLVFLVQRAVSFPGQFRSVERQGPPAGVDQVWLETSFGRVEAWLYPAPGRAPALVFFHGNGELIDDWSVEMQRFAALGVSVLAVEFPGYGRSEGKPKRSTVGEAASAAFDFLAGHEGVDPDRIVSWGRSMGGGAAADLALDRPVAGLVLLSTFSSTMDMAATILVPGFLVRDRFAPQEAVRAFEGPVLLMHGPTDEVIPYAQALQIAGARPGLDVIDLPCGHNDCAASWGEIAGHITDFLRREGITN
jgi:pimeloyl-ACP methyl ester carboxylesterase